MFQLFLTFDEIHWGTLQFWTFIVWTKKEKKRKKKQRHFSKYNLLQHYAKEIHRGLAQHEGEQIMTKLLFFLMNYPFKKLLKEQY